MVIKILVIIGLILSAYALWVKKHIDKKDYKPLCDVSKKISCSRAFGSTYGSLFGLPNPLLGIIFYAVIYVLFLYGNLTAIFYLSLLAVIGSIYLAYCAYFVLRTYCLVCTAIYIINILLLYFTYIALY